MGPISLALEMPEAGGAHCDMGTLSMMCAWPKQLTIALVPVLLAAAACGREFEGGGALRAQKVVLQREVDGTREVVARLERGEPLLPRDDVAISIDEGLVRDSIGAQLPFEADVDRFHLVLTEADVHFRGSPAVRLNGRLNLKERPDLSASVEVLGALEGIQVNVLLVDTKATIRWISHRHQGCDGHQPDLERVRPRRGGAPRPPQHHGPVTDNPDPGESAADHRVPSGDPRPRSD